MKLLYTMLCVVLFMSEAVYGQLELQNVFPEQSNTQLRDIRFYDQDFGVAVGFRTQSSTVFNGVIGITVDAGRNWDIITLDGMLFFGVDIRDRNHIMIVGFHNTSKGVIVHSSDMGVSWNTTLLNGGSMPDVTSLYAVRYLDDNAIIAAGFNGAIVKSTDGGTHWASVHDDSGWSIWNLRNTDDRFFATALTSENDTFFYKTYTSVDAGDSWEELNAVLPEGFGIEAIEVAENGYVYGFGNQDGKYGIIISEDNGATWSALYTSNDAGRLKCGFVNSGGEMYAGGENGKIIYKQIGQPWKEMHTADDLFIWQIFGNDGATYFATSSANLYQFTSAVTSAPDTHEQNAIVVHYDSTRQLLSVEGIDQAGDYILRMSSIDGRQIDYPVGESGSVNIKDLGVGVYVYMLLENGEPLASGKFLRN